MNRWRIPVRTHRHRGLTKIEVLFIAALCVLTVSLLGPYIYRQRLVQRRQMCEKRQIDVAQALLGYEESAGRFPGYRNPQGETAGGKRTATGWVFPLLPYLGRSQQADAGPYQELHAAHGSSGPDESRGLPPAKYLKELVCPDNGPTKDQMSSNWLAWVVNAGLPDNPNAGDLPPDWPANGVFLDHFARPPGADYEVSLDYLNEHDGAEHTLLLSENLDASQWTDSEEPHVAFLWAANLVNGEPSPQGVLLRINKRPGAGDGSLSFARPSSHHPGGVNAVFCDISTRFLSDNIDYLVFCRLMTPDGEAVQQSGSTKPVPAPFQAAKPNPPAP